jgi:hypothetical protein
MALPPGLATVTVTGRATRPGTGGTPQPLTGRVLFTPDAPWIVATATSTQVIGAVAADCDANGNYTAVLLAPDDTGISPTGWTYKVEMNFSGVPTPDPFHISLTKNTPTVSMGALIPVGPTGGGNVSGGTVNGSLRVTGNLTVDGSSSITALAHANKHATGGSDPITPASIGAEVSGAGASAVTTHAGAADPHGDRSWATGKFLDRTTGGTVNGNVTVNGTVSATGLTLPAGSVTSSKTAVFPSPTGAASYVVWRAAKPCTVIAVRGYRSGGTGVTVNASKNGTADLLATDLSLSTDVTWLAGASVQNAAMVAGDFLVMKITSVSGTPAAVTVQVDVQAA